MARKATPQPATPAAPRYEVAGPDLKGLALLLLSLVTALALLGIGPGLFNESVANTLLLLVGWGAYPLTLLVGILGLMILTRYHQRATINWGRVLVTELLLFCLLGLSSLLDSASLTWSEASSGRGGGILGWIAAQPFLLLGSTGAIVLLGFLTLLLLLPALGIPLARIQQTAEERKQRLETRRKQLAAPVQLMEPPSIPVARPSASEPVRTRAATAAPSGLSHLSAKPDVPVSGLGRLKEAVSRAASTTAATVATSTAKLAPQPGKPLIRPAKTVKRPPASLPPLDLLHRSDGNALDPNVAREKARVIEETLKSFGVPATVVQVNQGPAVTQFGVQPGFLEYTLRDGTVKQRKVKVNAITTLADDLALALAAKSIRVEAPVPGRPYVGIEVPNSDTEMVTLHSVLTSPEFKTINSDLTFALGRDVSGRPVAADLARMPHLLIAGATGSGKSVCVNTIIASLLFNLGPDQLKMLMIDPKMVELIPYNGIPHLIAPVVTDMERVVGALTWAMREMDRRYKLFSEAGKRNHESYNQWAIENGQETLPYIVILIDELADLMMVAADQVERIICRIAQMARATGMHLILATQRPSVDVVTGLIKANVPSRIAFAVASGIDSRVILDSTGAETLLGRGDMLFQAPDSSKLHRLQGCFVSDQELQAIVSHWVRYNPNGEPAREDATPWDEIVEEMADGQEQSDDLLEQAIAVVREHQWASTSFLQRKLRIGYTRAARLIDTLEEKGIIGPPEEGSNGSRVVLAEAPSSETDTATTP